MFGFFIEENNIPLDIQKERNKLTSIRLGKVTHVLTNKKPSLLPFKGKLPLIGINSISNYMDEFNQENLFEDLPRFLKKIVYKAEQIVYYSNRFNNFLSIREISSKDFESFNPHKKLEILNSFLEEEQTDTNILEIKDYE